MGSREERERKDFEISTKVGERRCPAESSRLRETADTRRLNQRKSLETKGFQDFFLLTLNKLFAFRSTLRSTKKELLTSSMRKGAKIPQKA